MGNVESIDEFYRRKFNWIPDSLKNEIGHFNVFRLDPYVGACAKPVPYKKRDYYKVMMVLGEGVVQYADRINQVKKQALSFSNPLIPYKWDRTDQIEGGFFCIFDKQFFHQYGDIDRYPVFQPKGKHIYELDDEQVQQATSIYRRMFEELGSDYPHKYDVLRNLVFELVHFAMKTQPAEQVTREEANASKRISTLFLELLERQFPIDESHQKVQLRSASDFAERLNVHVNHLNRAIKQTTQKTTTQLISERILQESKVLLKHSTWSVSEIAYALGFSEATHFNNFFKKNLQQNPTQFRSR